MNMKKVYITLFALIAVLVPAYAHACEWFCTCNCGGDDVVVIEHRVPTPSPQAQIMEPAILVAPNDDVVIIEPAVSTPSPKAQIMEPATPAVTPKDIPLLELTRDQAECINKPSQEANIALPTINEKASAALPISQSFKQRNPVPKPNPNEILLNLLKKKKDVAARNFLQENQLSHEMLDCRNSKGYTPLLYAIQYSYWDIVTLLLQQGATPPRMDQLQRVTTPVTHQTYTKILCAAYLTRKPLPSLQRLQEMGMGL
jgi:hypothetical protein